LFEKEEQVQTGQGLLSAKEEDQIGQVYEKKVYGMSRQGAKVQDGGSVLLQEVFQGTF
jgi:hypothetical protein